MSLLIPVEGDITVVPKNSSMRQAIGGYIEFWPVEWQLDKIKGSNGKIYQFQICVDEEGQLKDLPPNLRGTTIAHPLNIARKRFIYGPALLIPYESAFTSSSEDSEEDGENEKEDINYTLDDWKAIEAGCISGNVDLIAENTKGGTAINRY